MLVLRRIGTAPALCAWIHTYVCTRPALHLSFASCPLSHSQPVDSYAELPLCILPGSHLLFGDDNLLQPPPSARDIENTAVVFRCSPWVRISVSTGLYFPNLESVLAMRMRCPFLAVTANSELRLSQPTPNSEMNSRQSSPDCQHRRMSARG